MDYNIEERLWDKISDLEAKNERLKKRKRYAGECYKRTRDGN